MMCEEINYRTFGKMDFRISESNMDIGLDSSGIGNSKSQIMEDENQGESQMDVNEMNQKQINKENTKIMKNIYLISFAYFLVFTAYLGLARLQSSLHDDAGLGTISQSVLYASLVVSAMFLSNMFINFVGHKWAIPISIIGYIVWMLANGYVIFIFLTVC